MMKIICIQCKKEHCRCGQFDYEEVEVPEQ